MWWVYSYYKYFYSYSAVVVFKRRQNRTSVKVDPGMHAIVQCNNSGQYSHPNIPSEFIVY